MNVCVFCGSSLGDSETYRQAAFQTGVLLAKGGHSLIYGGGNVGLMGVLADATLQHGGRVTGIIPDFLLKREVGHRGVTNLEIVSSMHERKKRMADLADVFIALPGGWGTLEELAEILTWRQLRLIAQPVAILNTSGFFDPLLLQMQRMVETGFLQQANLDFLIAEKTPEQLLATLKLI